MKRVPGGLHVLLTVILALTARVSPADGDAFDVEAAYDNTEHRIPMRDGVELFTVVYAPKDRAQTYPILLNRTPCSYRSPLGLAAGEAFVESGYTFVIAALQVALPIVELTGDTARKSA